MGICAVWGISGADFDTTGKADKYVHDHVLPGRLRDAFDANEAHLAGSENRQIANQIIGQILTNEYH